MKRRLLLLWGVLAVVCFPSSGTAWSESNNGNWTSVDTKSESEADTLYNQGKFDAAEVIYHRVLENQPNSATALIFHVKALSALRRFPEALAESKKAVELEPANPVAQEWLGMALVLSGLYPEAITILKKSLALKPDEETASIWLAQAYLLDGNKERAEQIFNGLLQGRSEEQQSVTADRIANMFYEMGNSPFAVDWWKRSAGLGGKDAARWLSWAYSSGYGVPQDDGDSAYWSRRTDAAPFAWFSRLSIADNVVGWAHGWGLVLLVLLSAALLPVPTIGAVGYCFSRGLTTDPSVHWTERARRSYPFQIFLGFGALLLPVIYAAGFNYYPSFALPVPKWLLFWIVLAVGIMACNAVVVRWAQRYRDKAGTALQNLQDIGITLFIYLPTFVIFMIMAANLPAQWNLQAGLVIAAGVFAYFWIQFGGWIKLGRLFRLLVPANGELVDDAVALAHRWGRPKPAIWIIRWRKANALAFPFSNAIVVTEKLRAVLSRDETNAVLAHELAHLCEDQVTRFMRLLMPLLLLPLFTVSLWWPSDNWNGFIVCYAILIFGFFLLRKRARRMEERADSFGKEAEKEAGIYPLALAKLYEANLVPAVMSGKRKVHPHLYDRLLAAGVTPDYPRPKPPGRWGFLAAFLTIAANVICLTAIWLLLF